MTITYAPKKEAVPTDRPADLDITEFGGLVSRLIGDGWAVHGALDVREGPLVALLRTSDDK